MDNFANGPGIPMGFGMALMQNAEAMRRFTAMPGEARQRIIDGTHNIHSKPEMQEYVRKLLG